jgi:hypothetical protein
MVIKIINNMKLYENLNPAEKEMLLKFPAYISLLASNADGKMDDAEKKEAIKFTHIKTYSSGPEFSEFYKEAEAVFQKNIDQLDLQLPDDKATREGAINVDLEKLNAVLMKLGKENSDRIKKEMRSYMDHVSKAHSNVIESFLIPIHIDGLTD